MNNTLVPVYLGIGSNIEPEKNIETALGLLRDQFGCIRQSKRYQTKAVGFKGHDFINMVVVFDAQNNLHALLQELLKIEKACGRDRTQERGKGSRTMDLDLLLFGELLGKHQDCVLPRPEIFERQFVWQPLLELLMDSDLSDFHKEIKKRIAESSKSMPEMSRN